MTIIDPPTDAELAAYVNGNVPVVRALAIDAWAAHHPDNAAHVDAIRSLLASDSAAPQWNRDRMWATVRSAIGEESARRSGTASLGTVVPAPMRAPREHRRAFPIRLGVAAAAGLVLAAALYGGGSGRVLRAFGVGHDYVTRRGEQATVQLRDGTRITLAPESRLRVRAGYGRPERAVELEGEAVFDVVHDPAHRFSVHAGRAAIVDVGTRFDLRAYASDSVVRVAVVDGEVTLDADRTAIGGLGRGPDQPGLIVGRGALGRLDADGRARSAPVDNAADYLAWSTGRLVFDHEPLRDVLATISRWSDADLRVRDASLGSELVTAEFQGRAGPGRQTGAEMARALAQAVGASVEQSANTFTVVRR